MSVCVVRVYISIVDIVHQKFWSIDLMKSHLFFMFFFFLSLLFHKRADPLLLDSLGRTHPVCTWTQTKKQKQKKASKRSEKKGIEEVVVIVQILFFLSRQKILTLNNVDKE